MLVIRFQRIGRKNDPAFRIAVTEKRSRPKSAGIETLGSFHPKTKAVHLHGDRIRYWLAHGAKPSPRVWNLLVRHGVLGGKNIAIAGRPPSSAVSKENDEMMSTAVAADGSDMLPLV